MSQSACVAGGEDEDEELEGTQASNAWGSEITKTMAEDIKPPALTSPASGQGVTVKLSPALTSPASGQGVTVKLSHVSNLAEVEKHWCQTWMVMEYADKGNLQV
jgi:hypothetical protein